MQENVKAYQKIQVQTATPAQLIYMLYDGAIRFMTLGVEALDAGNIEQTNRHLTRAQRIVAELQVSLDLERGGAIAQNLNSLYDYIYRRLVEANLESARAPVEECLKLVGELKEAWTAVMSQERAARVAPARSPLPAARGGGLDIAC